jgi:hypothetical protein
MNRVNLEAVPFGEAKRGDEALVAPFARSSVTH